MNYIAAGHGRIRHGLFIKKRGSKASNVMFCVSMIFIIYGGQFGNTRDTYMLCWAQYELEQFSAAALPFYVAVTWHRLSLPCATVW